MSHTFTPSAAGPLSAGYTHPDDLTDDADAASVNGPMEAMGNDIAYIADGFTEFNGNKTFTGDLTLTASPAALIFDSTGRLQVDPNLMQLRNDSAAIPSITRAVNSTGIRFSPSEVWWPAASVMAVGSTYLFPLLELPNQCEIVSLTIRHNPNDATSPTTKPTLTIWRIPLAGGGAVDAFTPIQDPAVGGAYTVEHNFTATPGSVVTVDLTANSYWFKIEAETGGSALNGVLSAPPSITYRVPYLDLVK